MTSQTPMSLLAPQEKQMHVAQKGQLRYMRFGLNGGWQGALSLRFPTRPVFPYQRAFEYLSASLKRSPQRFLSLGVGTGTALATIQRLYPQTLLYGVDIVGEVIETAIQHFQAPDHSACQYYQCDAIQFVEQTQLRFDFIFVDVYLEDRIHPIIIQSSFLDALERILNNKGTVIFNLIAKTPPVYPYTLFLKYSQTLFRSRIWLPVGMPLIEGNLLCVLSKDANPFQFHSDYLRNIRSRANFYYNWFDQLECKLWMHRLQILNS